MKNKFTEWEYHSRNEKIAGFIIFFILMPLLLVYTMPQFLGLYLFMIGFIAVLPYLFELALTQRLPTKVRIFMILGIIFLFLGVSFHYNWMSFRSVAFSATGTCSDSDGGVNYYVQGTVSVSSNTYTDFCQGDSVFEWWCDSPNANSPTGKNHYCEYGCSNGACKSPPTPTTLPPTTTSTITTTTTTPVDCNNLCLGRNYDWGVSCSINNLPSGTKEFISDNNCCCGNFVTTTTTTTTTSTTTTPPIPPEPPWTQVWNNFINGLTTIWDTVTGWIKF